MDLLEDFLLSFWGKVRPFSGAEQKLFVLGSRVGRSVASEPLRSVWNPNRSMQNRRGTSIDVEKVATRKQVKYHRFYKMVTLPKTNIAPKNGILKMIFLFPRWDMLIPWRVSLSTTENSKKNQGDI